MSPLLAGAAGFVAGGAVAVLVFYLIYRQYVKPVVEAPWNFTATPPNVPLEPSSVKFRVILYTSSGARARQLFEKLEPSPEVQYAESVELRHFNDVRGRKP